jgi:hypothetical protein
LPSVCCLDFFLKKEAIYSIEISVPYYWTIQPLFLTDTNIPTSDHIHPAVCTSTLHVSICFDQASRCAVQKKTDATLQKQPINVAYGVHNCCFIFTRIHCARMNTFHREGTHYRFNYTVLLLFDLKFRSVVNSKKFNEVFKRFSCLEEGYIAMTYTAVCFYVMIWNGMSVDLHYVNVPETYSVAVCIYIYIYIWFVKFYCNVYDVFSNRISCA